MNYFCPYCGARIRRGRRSCSRCGRTFCRDPAASHIGKGRQQHPEKKPIPGSRGRHRLPPGTEDRLGLIQVMLGIVLLIVVIILIA